MSASSESTAGKAASVVTFLYEAGDGGLDRVAILIANGLARRGLHSELWLSRADGPLRGLIAPEVQIRLVPTPQIGRRKLRLFLQIPALARMLRQLRPDVIMSAGNQSNLTVALAVLLARNGVTQTLQKITNPLRRPGHDAFRRFLRECRFGLAARLGRRTLTLSQADARLFAETYPRLRDRFSVVCNPYVSAEMLAAGNSRVAPPSDAPLLLAVGRLAPQKDHATLLAALARLQSRPWTLVMLGEGPLAAALAQQARDLGIADRIRFTGFVEQRVRWYEQAQILILSSRWEGLPAVPIEAMACGCAVISTDCSPGLRELLRAAGMPDPVPVGDAGALARAIAAQLDTAAASAPAVALAARYSVDAAVEDHLRCLRELMSGRSVRLPAPQRPSGLRLNRDAEQ